LPKSPKLPKIAKFESVLEPSTGRLRSFDYALPRFAQDFACRLPLGDASLTPPKRLNLNSGSGVASSSVRVYSC
jgi:hypothetical protein